MKKFFILAVVVFACKSAHAANWCGLPTCGNGQHIDCLTDAAGDWGPSCPTSTTATTMLNLADFQTNITNQINTYRNNIAGGKVAGFQPATRMGTLSWNVTLANLCRENVRLCLFKQDGCRNTPDLDFVGQNIAERKYGINVNLQNGDILNALIALWYAQISQTTMANVNQCPGTDTTNNFLQLIKAYATRIGCAAAKITTSTDITVLFCCNFDMGNIKSWPAYTSGTAASGCTTGKNPSFTNLCSTNEVYNTNDFWEDYY